MTRKWQTTFCGIPKVIFFLLYLPFIFIQGFSYYQQTQSLDKVDTQICTYKNITCLKGSNTKVYSNKAPKKSNVRLNKRFEPSNILLCNNKFLEITYFKNVTPLFNNYNNPFFYSAYSLTNTTRGPPQVV